MIGSPSTGKSNIDFNANVYSDKIGALSTARGAIEGATEEISSLIDQSSHYWTGPAQASVRAAYGEVKIRMKKLIQAIDEVISSMQKIVSLMGKTETQNEISGNAIKSAAKTLSI